MGRIGEVRLVGVLCCRRPQPVPQSPRLSAPSRFNRVAILRSRNRRRSPPGGRWADLLVPEGRLYRSIGLRVTAHQRQPRQFAFGYAGFGGRKRIEADAVTPVGEVTTTNVFFQRAIEFRTANAYSGAT